MARQLLPHSTAPPTVDPPAAPTSGQKRKRPNGILAVACLACQKRKQKCDGARPACRSCASKKIACVYDVPEGQTRLAALKSNNAQLQSRVWASGNLLWALKTSPPNDVAQILERIRSSDDPSLILDDFDLEPGALKPPPSRAASAPTSPLHCSSEPAYYPLESISIDNLHPSNEHCLSASVLALLGSPANREALQLFLQCTGLLFHVFSKTQADAVLEEVLNNADTAIAKTSLCEVCAMAAVAAQYLQGNTAPSTGHHFYNVARQYLDDAIVADPLRAMKSCALLAMYNIVTKASVALAFVEMGLGLGTSQNMPKGDPPACISLQLWHGYRNAWRTLLCCKGWLVVTPSYPLRDDWIENPIASMDAPSGSVPLIADRVQREMTRLAIIKTRMSLTPFSFTESSKDAIESIKADLHRWYDQLDPSMQLAPISGQTIDRNCRRGIYLMHCLHLGTMMFLQRQILQEYVSTANFDPKLADETIRNLSDSVEEGFAASTTSARILGLIHADGGIFQRCWLCIYQSYMATTEILFMTTQKLLHGFPGAQCRPDLAVATQSLAVLEFCANADHLAKELLSSVQNHYEYLDSMTKDDVNSVEQMYCFSPPQEPAVAHLSLPWETLLKLPTGDSKLHKLSQHLMARICSPLADIKVIGQRGFRGPVASSSIPMPLSSAEEAAIGTHLDWSADGGLCGADAPTNSMGNLIFMNLGNDFFDHSNDLHAWTNKENSLGS